VPETTQRLALTIAEAASACGVSRKVIDGAVRSKALPAKHIGKGDERLHARILMADLKAWLAALPDA
jgi:hypothetical protein